MLTTILLVIIYLSFISLGLPDTLLGSAWPAIYQEIGVPVSSAGVIYMIVSAGTILSSFFSDKITRRLGTGMVTFISVLMTAVALLGISFGNHFLVFCVMAIPLGLGAGSVDAALNNYVALHFSARHMNWLHCFWGIGATLGPMIMSLFLDHESAIGNWKTGYRTVGIFQVLLVIILFAALPLWKKTAAPADEAEQKQAPPKTRTLIRFPGAKEVFFSFFCYCAIEATTGLWGSSYLVFVKGITTETAAKWVAVFFFGITLGRFAAGLLSVKVNNRNMIRLGEVLIAIGMVFLFIPMGNWILPPAFFLMGLGCAPIYPALIHETPVSFGSANSQAIIGIQMAVAYIGNIAMPPLFGLLAHISYGLFPLYLIALLVIMAVLVETSVYKIRKKQSAV